MNMSLLASLTLASLSPFSNPALAAINVATPSFVYRQDFDSLTTSTVAVPWTNDSSLPGWYLFSRTLADAATIAADNGGSNTGTLRSFNTAWANNDTLWLRWVERNDTDNDHGLAIDDLSLRS